MSSRKFSYWSSPQTTTRSGLKSSRILRIARKSLPKRSPQRWAADSPSSLPSSASNSGGQLAGSLRAASTLGARKVVLKTPVSPSFGMHKVGQCVTPRPSISAIFLFLPLECPLALNLILTARLETKGVLAIHRPDRVPIEADMAGHGIGVTPRPLHRVAEMQAITASRGVERFDRLYRELGNPSLIAAAANAVGNCYLFTRVKFLRHVVHIRQQDQLGALNCCRRLGVAQLDRRELGHRQLTAVERTARRTHRGRGQHRSAVDQQRHTVKRVLVVFGPGRSA